MLDNNLAILKRAKLYIEQLSQGIDPISGDSLPDDTVVQNERISKCFSYISDVLGLVIDFGGIAALSAAAAQKPEAAGKTALQPLQPFCLSPSQRQSVFITEKPSDISTLTRSINDAADTRYMRRLKGQAFATWLFKNGYIERDGNTRKPTPVGVSLGITNQVKQTNQLMYSREAQLFLLDRIDEIIAISNGS